MWVRARSVGLALTFVAVIALAGASESEAAFPGLNGRIAFTRLALPYSYIYTVSPNGSGAAQFPVLPESLSPSDAAWSPDGTKIAFSAHNGDTEIYVINSNGSGQTQLTTNSSSDFAPAWSPEGTKIAFQSDRDSGGAGLSDIYVMNANGSSQTRLTTDRGVAPAWSPDGSKIAFTGSGEYGIMLINPDGSGKMRLTEHIDSEPNWSPDGSKIAFHRFVYPPVDDGDRDIYVMNANGSGQTRLTTSEDGDYDPAWSPDGQRIAFYSTRLSTTGDIYVMNANGSAQTALTDDIPGQTWKPDWQPARDGDADGVMDDVDNCPTNSNPTQADFDGDGQGDRCDSDDDDDGIPDGSDNCRLDADPDQTDQDADGAGLPCDPHDSGNVTDFDQDGCSDGTELNESAAFGGERDPNNFWDLMSVFTGSPLTRDRAVSGADLGAVVARFGSNDTGPGPFNRNSDRLSTPNLPTTPSGHRQNYHPSYDRGGTAPGADPWDLLPPNGAISGGDLSGTVIQFGHSCT